MGLGDDEEDDDIEYAVTLLLVLVPVLAAMTVIHI